MKLALKKNPLCSPTDILLYACALMSYWAGLYGVEMHGKIMEGMKILISCVHKMMAQQKHPSPTLLLEGPARLHEIGDEAFDDEA